MSDKLTRLEADAIASVKLDAGDTRPEIDLRAAVRDLAEALEYSQKRIAPLVAHDASLLSAWDFSARALMAATAAIAAAKEET